MIIILCCFIFALGYGIGNVVGTSATNKLWVNTLRDRAQLEASINYSDQNGIGV